MNARLVKKCLEEVKRRLKRKGIAYGDVAERLQVSEVTVKRMLNQNDIGLARLSALAELVDCSLSGLINKAEQTLPEIKCFSQQQDATFVRHPHLFQYYMELHKNGLAPESVAKRHGLDDLSTYLYLRKLEDLELITLLPDSKVKAPEYIMTFATDSRFVKRGVAWSLEQATRALLDDDENVSDMSMLFLPEKLCQQLMEELEKVFHTFADEHAGADWGTLRGDNIRQLVTFHDGVKSRYPEYDVVRLRDGDLD